MFRYIKWPQIVLKNNRKIKWIHLVIFEIRIKWEKRRVRKVIHSICKPVIFFFVLFKNKNSFLRWFFIWISFILFRGFFYFVIFLTHIYLERCVILFFEILKNIATTHFLTSNNIRPYESEICFFFLFFYSHLKNWPHHKYG